MKIVFAHRVVVPFVVGLLVLTMAACSGGEPKSPAEPAGTPDPVKTAPAPESEPAPAVEEGPTTEKLRGTVREIDTGIFFDYESIMLTIEGDDGEYYSFYNMHELYEQRDKYIGKPVVFEVAIRTEDELVCYGCTDREGLPADTKYEELQFVDGVQGDMGLYFTFSNRAGEQVELMGYDVYEPLDLQAEGNTDALNQWVTCGIATRVFKDELVSFELAE